MSPQIHLFADRILNLSITGPVVRLELGLLQPPKAEGESPRLVAGQTLVMPLEGFLAAADMLNAAIKKMMDDGLIKAKAPETTTVLNSPSTRQ